jgi:glyoxylase-like metal-dependent hydrolase (beta-lactamase superfamily II)
MPQTNSHTSIADDIIQVRLPLPFALNIVNCYLIRGDDGWTVLDTGLNTPPAQETWNAAFAALGITPSDVDQIILTHVHPDHFGMAGWFQALGDKSGAIPPVKTSPREAEMARQLWGGEGELSHFDQFLAVCGMPPEMIDTVVTSLAATAEATLPLPTHVETLTPGDNIKIGKREFTMIHAPGHSDGQLIFYDPADQLMLSGDHVLMKITPNIGRWPDTEPDPLGRFLDSLRSLQTLEVRLALPGHKALITDWRGRIAELLQHHEARLSHTLNAIDGGATVYEASLKVFNSFTFTAHEWRFAMVETLAHLEYLQLRGRVQQETRDDGTWLFNRIPSSKSQG